MSGVPAYAQSPKVTIFYGKDTSQDSRCLDATSTVKSFLNIHSRKQGISVKYVPVDTYTSINPNKPFDHKVHQFFLDESKGSQYFLILNSVSTGARSGNFTYCAGALSIFGAIRLRNSYELLDPFIETYLFTSNNRRDIISMYRNSVKDYFDALAKSEQ